LFVFNKCGDGFYNSNAAGLFKKILQVSCRIPASI